MLFQKLTKKAYIKPENPAFYKPDYQVNPFQNGRARRGSELLAAAAKLATQTSGKSVLISGRDAEMVKQHFVEMNAKSLWR